MLKPRLLDLFCGAGGAGMGYHRAGFEVVGVDIAPQKRYPFEFHQADALEFLQEHGHEFDAIHASPPCQGYSKLRFMNPGASYIRLIEPTRELLVKTAVSYVIENVEGSPLQIATDLFGHGVLLCGSMFGLGIEKCCNNRPGGYLRRHRYFETSFPVAQPKCNHVGRAVGVYGHGGHNFKHRMLYAEEAAIALRIDWMNRDEMCQAIPPAYTEYIGRQLIEALKHMEVSC